MTRRQRPGPLPEKVVGLLDEHARDPSDPGEDPGRQPRAGEPGQEITPGPGERRPRSRDRAALDLGEPPEQAAVAEVAEAREVVAVLVDLLHERDLGVDDAARSQHAIDLVDAADRVGDMFEDGLNDDAVDAAVRERQIVAVAEQQRRRSGDGPR